MSDDDLCTCSHKRRDHRKAGDRQAGLYTVGASEEFCCVCSCLRFTPRNSTEVPASPRKTEVQDGADL